MKFHDRLQLLNIILHLLYLQGKLCKKLLTYVTTFVIIFYADNIMSFLTKGHGKEKCGGGDGGGDTSDKTKIEKNNKDSNCIYVSILHYIRKQRPKKTSCTIKSLNK